MPSAIECVSPRMWRAFPNFVENRSSERRALVAARDQRRSVKRGETSQVQHKCTLVVYLVQRRWCIEHERLSHLRREVFPRARPKCDGLDKLLRTQLRLAQLGPWRPCRCAGWSGHREKAGTSPSRSARAWTCRRWCGIGREVAAGGVSVRAKGVITPHREPLLD